MFSLSTEETAALGSLKDCILAVPPDHDTPIESGLVLLENSQNLQVRITAEKAVVKILERI